jgi:hemoglobin-like flavoprotein
VPKQITLFEESYARIFGDQVGITQTGDAFFDRFYDIFLSKSPRIANMFSRTDMSRQATMLRRSLYEFVTFYVTGQVNEEMRRIAGLHQRLDISADLFDLWLDALVETVAEVDEECTELIEFAWRLAMAPGITYVKLWSDTNNSPVDGP